MDPKPPAPPPITEDQKKEFFKDLARQRREKGIKLGRWQIMLDANQLTSVDEFWTSWVNVLGKQKAGDYLVTIMAKAHEHLRAAVIRRQEEAKKQKGKIEWKKTSAPRVT